MIQKESDNFNRNHPERQPDEVFITNADDNTEYSEDGSSSWQNVGWVTKRRGQTAYDTEGKLLGNRWNGAFPVFAKQSEIRERKNGEEILARLVP